MNELPPVLDVCCGSKMFWFNSNDARALFNDVRKQSYICKDSSSRTGLRQFSIDPNTQHSFTNLPFPENSFSQVVFDPPHLTHGGKTSWIIKKYGKLEGDWRSELEDGFRECFRVLKPLGTLVFKWNETDIKVSEILKLTPVRPLFGNRCGKQSKTHWIVFIKEGEG